MKALHNYIDICLIDEYADKDFQNGWSLDIDCLSEYEKANFIDELMRHDTSVRDLVYYHMQKLIDDRLPECEAKDRKNAGLKLVKISNGDSRLETIQGHY